MSLPDLPFALAMGPQRAGTSWLDRLLRARGDVCLPNGVKETLFFDQHFERGVADYARHFRPAPQHVLAMEVTTTVFDVPEAPRRVRDLLGPDVRLVCPLREPVARSWSLYRHMKRYGQIDGSLAEAVERQPRIVESSRYAEHLTRWMDVFGPGSVQVVFQEDLERDADAFVDRVCGKLGLESHGIPDELLDRVNVGADSRSRRMAALAQRGGEWLREHRLYGIINTAKSLGLKKVAFEGGKQSATMSDGDRALLEGRLGGEIERLEALLGRGIDRWALVGV